MLRALHAQIPKPQTAYALHALLLLLFLLASPVNSLFCQALPSSGRPTGRGSLRQFSAPLPQRRGAQGYEHSSRSSPFTNHPCAGLLWVSQFPGSQQHCFLRIHLCIDTQTVSCNVYLQRQLPFTHLHLLKKPCVVISHHIKDPLDS